MKSTNNTTKTNTALCGLLSGLLLLAAGTTPAQAGLIDVTFSQSSWSPSSNVTVTSSVTELIGFGSNTGSPGNYIGLSGVGNFGEFGFFQDFAYDFRLGAAAYSATPTTFGPTLPPGVGLGTALFQRDSIGIGVFQDQEGYLGFKTAAGNFGYVEFDWIRSTQTLTILSAKMETDPGVGITVVPEPTSALLLLGSGAMLLLRRRRAAV